MATLDELEAATQQEIAGGGGAPAASGIDALEQQAKAELDQQAHGQYVGELKARGARMREHETALAQQTGEPGGPGGPGSQGYVGALPDEAQIRERLGQRAGLPSSLPQRGIPGAAVAGLKGGAQNLWSGLKELAGGGDYQETAEAMNEEASHFAPPNMGERLVGGLAGSAPTLAALMVTKGRAAGSVVPRLMQATRPLAPTTLVGGEAGAINLLSNVGDQSQTPAEAISNAIIEAVMTRAGGSFEPGFRTPLKQLPAEGVKEFGEEALTSGFQDVSSQILGRDANGNDPLNRDTVGGVVGALGERVANVNPMQSLQAAGEGGLVGSMAAGGLAVPRAVMDLRAEQVRARQEQEAPARDAALAAMSPDAAVARAQDPGQGPRLWSEIERRAELEAVDPQAQRLADEEAEGAIPQPDPEQEAAQAAAIADDQAWQDLLGRYRARGEQIGKDEAKDEQFRQHVLQKVRERASGRPEKNQIADPYEVERQQAAGRESAALAERTTEQARRLAEEEQAPDQQTPEVTDAQLREDQAPVAQGGPVAPRREVAGSEAVPGAAAGPGGIQVSRGPGPAPRAPDVRSSGDRPAGGRLTPGDRPEAIPVRSVTDLHRGFREVYGLPDDEATAATALVRARAAALGIDADVFTRERIQEVRRGKGSPSLNQKGAPTTLLQADRSDPAKWPAWYPPWKSTIDTGAGGRPRLKKAVYLKDGSRITGLTDRSRTVAVGYDKNGRESTRRVYEIDPDEIVLDGADRVAESLRDALLRHRDAGALYQEGARVIPRDESLAFQHLRRQWQKAHGVRPEPGTPTWEQLQQRAAKVDRERGILYQEEVGRLSDAPAGKGTEKGAISFAADGRAVIHALRSPDISTAVHELGHLFRRTLSAREMEIAGRWAGARNGHWGRGAEEKFARGFERYLRDGEAPVPALRAIFEKLRTWMRTIYQSIKGTPLEVELTPEIRALFGRMLTPAKGSEATLSSTPVPRGTGVENKTSLPTDTRPQVAPLSAPPSEGKQESRAPEKVAGGANPPVGTPKPTRETPLAIPAVDQQVRDQIADLDRQRGQPERRPQDQVREAAAGRLERDYEGERKRLLARATNGEQLSDVETAMAQEVLRRDVQKALASGTAADRSAMAALHAAYRDTGTSAARSLAMRRDPAESPNRRALRMVVDSIMTPPKPLRDAMAKVRGKIQAAEESGNAEAATKAKAQLLDLVTKGQRRLERVRSFFAKEGIDLLYQGQNIDYIAGMANAASKANGTFNGALREYWINSILSGPRSLVVNAAAVNQMYELGVGKLGEALLNTVIRNLDAATLREYRTQWKGLLPGLARGLQNAVRSFMTERPVFGEELDGQTQFDDHGPQIAGLKGRIIRLPSRLLLAADQFNKTWGAHVEVMGQAYRMAKRQLGPEATEEQLTARIQDLVADLESPAWDIAKERAATYNFQGDVPGAIKGVMKIRDAQVPGTDLRPLFYIIPFIKTPTNIIRIGAKASPLGLARVLWKATTGTYEPGEMVADAAQQIVSWTVSVGLMALAGMEDDEGRPYLTGSEGAYRPGKPGVQQETMKPYTLRLPGTATTLDYQRIEPVATWLGLVADGTRIAKRAAKGQGVSDTIGQVKDAVSAQVLDKSMLKSVADLYKAFAPGEQSEGNLATWSRNFATSWIPNVWRAPARDADDTVREGGVWGQGSDFWRMYFQRIGQSAVPWTQRPRINLLGDEVRKSDDGPLTDTVARMSRLVSPSVIGEADKPEAIYQWLTRWNNDPTKKAWYPSQPAKDYKVGEEKRFLTDEQYEHMQRRAGTLLKQRLGEIAKDPELAHLRLTPERPTEQQQKMLKRLIAATRKRARADVLRGESRSADDEDLPAAGDE